MEYLSSKFKSPGSIFASGILGCNSSGYIPPRGIYVSEFCFEAVHTGFEDGKRVSMRPISENASLFNVINIEVYRPFAIIGERKFNPEMKKVSRIASSTRALYSREENLNLEKNTCKARNK